MAQKIEILMNLVDNITKPIEAIQKKLTGLTDVFKNLTANVINPTRALKASREEMQNMLNGVQKLQAAFLTLGFGFLFTGLAIKRFAETALRSIFNTFVTVVDGSDESLQNILALQAAFEFLKFSIAEALLQSELFQFLIDIAIQVIDFFTSLPESVKTGIGIALIGLLILGAVLSFIGQIFLGLIPLILLFGPAFEVSFAAGIAAIGSFLGTLLLAIVIIIAVIILITAIIKSNVGGIGDFFKETFGIIFETVKEVFLGIFKIIKDIFSLIVAILTGDWEKAWELFKRIVINTIRVILIALAGLGAVVINIVFTMINIVNDLFFKGLLGGILFILEKIGDGFFALARVIVTALATPIEIAVDAVRTFLSFFSKIPGIGGLFESALQAIPTGENLVQRLTNALTPAVNLFGEMRKDVNKVSDALKLPIITMEKFKEITADINAEMDSLEKKFVNLPEPIEAVVETTKTPSAIEEIMNLQAPTIQQTNNINITGTEFDSDTAKAKIETIMNDSLKSTQERFGGSPASG